MALYAGIELTSAVQWAAGVHVALGWALGGLFAAVAGSALLAWREYRRVYGLLTGVETRTSSPLRITRGEDGHSRNTRGLFPAGEGAGYAGGILSAGVDGI